MPKESQFVMKVMDIENFEVWTTKGMGSIYSIDWSYQQGHVDKAH